MAVPTGAKPRGIRVRTAHTTEAEFVAAFIELCDEGSVFAPTEKMKPIGADCAFSLELADGTAMVRGLGSIRNAWPTDDSPFGRPGIHITIDQLTTGTEPIFQKLLEARSTLAHKPRTRPAPSTHQLWGPPAGPPTEEMLAVEPEEPEVQELPHKITRELKSPTPPEDLTHEAFMEDPARPGKASRAGTIPELAPVPVPRARLASAPVIPLPATATDDVDAALAASRPKPWWMNARVGGVFAAGLLLGLLMSLVFSGGDDDNKKVAASAAPAVVAKAEPANCPPPPEPTALAAAPVEEVEAPPAEPKARKKSQVASATPGPKKVAAKPTTTTSETKTAAAIKPTAFAPSTASTTKTAKTTTTTPTTKTAATTPTTKSVTTTPTKTATTTASTTPTTKTAATSSTKTATTSTTKTASTTKPSTSTTATTKTTKPATTTKVATTKPAAKPKKGACSSLDCL